MGLQQGLLLWLEKHAKMGREKDSTGPAFGTTFGCQFRAWLC
jgi:hypothetical protein